MKIIFVVFISLLISCNSETNLKRKEEKLSSEYSMQCPIGICENYKNKQTYKLANDYLTISNLSKVGPLNFLQYLKNFECYDIMIPSCRFPNNWINKNNLSSLVAMLDDKTPCTKIHVLSTESKTVNLDSSNVQSSTIGLESLRLINGYLLKQYPCNIIWNKDSVVLKLALIKKK
jgi:hypothetical protein